MLELHEWPPEEIARVRFQLKRLTATRIENPYDVEDLVQDTFLTMTQKLPGLELRKGLLVWGMAILRRKVGNYYRRGRRYVSIEEPLVSALLPSLVEAPASVESSLMQREIQAQLDLILGEFSPLDRALLEKLLAGNSMREILRSSEPGRNQNVITRVHRARKKLHEKLTRCGYVLSGPRKNKPRKKLVPGS